ncbi:unnamed protein product [Cylindrotheca closterium]|uniref:Uncharacterized protein n=1 Tax=Cylindrotheca closterium TaxID=2856 RepID=A0AAD2CST2_9STRA|nr:unnamed protein product [Cylindrotheca closterium]
MSDYHVFPMQYEPMEGENLRVKVDVDHSTFSVYLKKLDITQMSLHKCVDFAQTILDDVTLTSSSVEPSTSFGQRLSLLSNDKFGKRSQTTWTWTRNPLRTGKKKVRDWILTKCTEDDAAAVLNQLRTWRKPRLATLATIMDNQMYMKKLVPTIRQCAVFRTHSWFVDVDNFLSFSSVMQMVAEFVTANFLVNMLTKYL